jgi:hypothetical protein
VIESFRQYLKTFGYIADNPIKAELAEKAKDYSYGGIQQLQKGVYELPRPTEVDYRIG